MIISRRHFLAAVPLLSVTLPGCTTTTVNGVTTVTINLATLQVYATAVQNGVTTLLGIPVINTALGPAKIALIDAVVADMAAQVAALNAANNGVATLTFTAASVPAALTAFETDTKAIMADLVVVATNLSGSLASNIVTTVDALQTILALGEAVSTTVGAPLPRMDVRQALKILGA
jgi:hypothetical protein